VSFLFGAAQKYLKEFRMSKNFGLAVAAAADSEQKKRNNSMKKMKRKTNLLGNLPRVK